MGISRRLAVGCRLTEARMCWHTNSEIEGNGCFQPIPRPEPGCRKCADAAARRRQSRNGMRDAPGTRELRHDVS